MGMAIWICSLVGAYCQEKTLSRPVHESFGIGMESLSSMRRTAKCWNMLDWSAALFGAIWTGMVSLSCSWRASGGLSECSRTSVDDSLSGMRLSVGCGMPQIDNNSGL